MFREDRAEALPLYGWPAWSSSQSGQSAPDSVSWVRTSTVVCMAPPDIPALTTTPPSPSPLHRTPGRRWGAGWQGEGERDTMCYRSSLHFWTPPLSQKAPWIAGRKKHVPDLNPERPDNGCIARSEVSEHKARRGAEEHPSAATGGVPTPHTRLHTTRPPPNHTGRALTPRSRRWMETIEESSPMIGNGDLGHCDSHLATYVVCRRSEHRCPVANSRARRAWGGITPQLTREVRKPAVAEESRGLSHSYEDKREAERTILPGSPAAGRSASGEGRRDGEAVRRKFGGADSQGLLSPVTLSHVTLSPVTLSPAHSDARHPSAASAQPTTNGLTTGYKEKGGTVPDPDLDLLWSARKDGQGGTECGRPSGRGRGRSHSNGHPAVTPTPSSPTLAAGPGNSTSFGGHRRPEGREPLPPSFLSLLVRFFGKDVDVGRPHAQHGREKMDSVSTAGVHFRKKVDVERRCGWGQPSLAPSSGTVLVSVPDRGLEAVSVTKVTPRDVWESVTVVKLPRREERRVESGVHFTDSRRYRDTLHVQPVMTALHFADTLIVYGHTTSRRRFITTALCQPRITPKKMAETHFIFQAKTASHQFVSVLTYHIDQCRKWFTTGLQLTTRHLSAADGTLDCCDPSLMTTSASFVTSDGPDDVREKCWASEVLIPHHSQRCWQLGQKQFKVAHPERKLDCNMNKQTSVAFV